MPNENGNIDTSSQIPESSKISVESKDKASLVVPIENSKAANPASFAVPLEASEAQLNHSSKASQDSSKSTTGKVATHVDGKLETRATEKNPVSAHINQVQVENLKSVINSERTKPMDDPTVVFSQNVLRK